MVTETFAVTVQARRVRNWLMGQQMKQAQQATTSPRPPLYPDPETADMTEAERLAQYEQSPEYQARQERYTAWHKREQEIARLKQAEAARRNAAEAARKAQEWQAAQQARRLPDGGAPSDDAPFQNRAFHATKLATAVHNVKVATQRKTATAMAQAQAPMARYNGR